MRPLARIDGGRAPCHHAVRRPHGAAGSPGPRSIRHVARSTQIARRLGELRSGRRHPRSAMPPRVCRGLIHAACTYAGRAVVSPVSSLARWRSPAVSIRSSWQMARALMGARANCDFDNCDLSSGSALEIGEFSFGWRPCFFSCKLSNSC